MKTSIPTIKNVRLKDGGANLYLLPTPQEKALSDIYDSLAEAAEYIENTEREMESISVLVVNKDGSFYIRHGGSTTPAHSAALQFIATEYQQAVWGGR